MRDEQLDQLFHMRQQDLAPVDLMRGRPIFAVGAGGVNSHFCLLGSKIGFDITVYDGDTVAAENVGSQLFGPNHVGRPKPEVVQEICTQLAGAQVKTVNAFVRGGEPLAGIVVEAVDSMAARMDLWHHAILPRAGFIDAMVSVRMGAESGSVIVVRPNLAVDQIWYTTAALYPDERTMPLPCTARATSYCATIAAALAVRAVKRLLLGQRAERRLDFDLNGLMFVVEE